MIIEVTGQIVRNAMGEYLTSALPSSLGWVVCDGAIIARDAAKRECDRQMWEAVADLGAALRDKLRGYEDATYEATKGKAEGTFTAGLAACIRGLALAIKALDSPAVRHCGCAGDCDKSAPCPRADNCGHGFHA